MNTYKNPLEDEVNINLWNTLVRVSFAVVAILILQRFSLRKSFFDLLYRDDTASPLFKVATQDVAVRVGQGEVIQEQERRYEVSKLSNGITVLTESASAPSRVDFGILLDVGTRDENSETSGALLSIKNTYFKTVLNTNETINYGLIQMSGGDFNVDYDQEQTYFKAHCLAHDAVDVFKTIVDCALEPRSVVTASVGQEKNAGTHHLESIVKSGEHFNEAIFKTAFGNQGLGMPLRGKKSNIGNLSAYTLQKFQLENIDPSRIIVCAAGIYNHNEFAQLAQDSLQFISAYQGQRVRQPTQYVGGEVRNLTDSYDLTLALLFPSVNWTSKQLAVFQVLNSLLGGHGSQQSALQRNILSKHSFVDHAESVNFNFTDAGLFGVKISGSAERGTDILNATIRQLKDLTGPISNIELARAKAILKNQLYQALERSEDRLEEAARSLKVFNAVKLNEYGQHIDSVTGEQINQAVAQLLSTQPTFVAEGGLANRLPTYDQILNSLK